jgi:signal transduction histidine kinase/ActR/RegA family two-component response regulator
MQGEGLPSVAGIAERGFRRKSGRSMSAPVGISSASFVRAQESQALLEFTLDAANLGRWQADLVSGSIEPSARFEQILGFAPGSQSWNHEKFLAQVHPDDQAAVALAIYKDCEFECRILRADQAMRWIWGKSMTYRAIDGQQRRSGLIKDITDRKDAEFSLREIDRRKDEFLATLAHELRNPLAPLRNGLQIMKLASDDAEVVAQTREMMERQLQHMVRLVNDLLDVSRFSRGKLTLQKQRIDIVTVIESALETSRPLIDVAGHELVVQRPAQALCIDGDITRLSQIVSNLLDNASKYTPNGGRIEVGARADKGFALIWVKDNGAGIDRTMLPRVFEAFAQTTPSIERLQGGLGIGLSIVKRLVEMHGGSVEVQSAGRGAGSEFLLRLPLAELAADAEIASAQHAAQNTPAAAIRILIVDDNLDSAMSLAAILELEGHEITTAHDGLAAVKAAAKIRPDVIFLDIGLPELNGYEVCKRIRQQAHGEDIFIAALTGWAQPQDQECCRAAGFDRHLVKPVEIRAIQQLLDEIGRKPKIVRRNRRDSVHPAT